MNTEINMTEVKAIVSQECLPGINLMGAVSDAKLVELTKKLEVTQAFYSEVRKSDANFEDYGVTEFAVKSAIISLVEKVKMAINNRHRYYG